MMGKRPVFAGGVLLRLAAYQLAGRRFWLLVLLPLVWHLFQAILLLTGGRPEPFSPVAAQNTLIGLPTAVLALFLGVRVIAGEIDGRSLEIAYTVPGGAHRLWLAKLLAAWLLLVLTVLLLAAVTFLFFTSFPLAALYGALQAASLYLVVAMGLATLTRSEVAGAMIAIAVLALNGLLTGFGDNQLRISPFWNPLAVSQVEPFQLFAWTLQNRIGVLLAIVALCGLAFSRAERRETMLG